jgi:hypothetical protein
MVFLVDIDKCRPKGTALHRWFMGCELEGRGYLLEMFVSKESYILSETVLYGFTP